MFRVALCSVAFASILSFLITLFIYLMQTTVVELNSDVILALADIFWFWFVLTWSGTLLIALFRSLKYIFNTCFSIYKIKLLSCDTKEIIEVVGYGDLVKVWRKFFMLLIWFVAFMMIISLVITYLLSEYTSIFQWFNIFWLFGFVLMSGYPSFVLMIAKCKRIKLMKC